jgi:hypothetical protein
VRRVEGQQLANGVASMRVFGLTKRPFALQASVFLLFFCIPSAQQASLLSRPCAWSDAATTAAVPARYTGRLENTQRMLSDMECRLEQQQRKSWCHIAGCGRRSSYAEAEGPLRFCAAHRNSSHIHIYTSRGTTRRCQAVSCNKQPNFGAANSKAEYCRAHKKAHHINVNRPTCAFKGCTKTRCFGEGIADDFREEPGQPRLKPGEGKLVHDGVRRRRGRAQFCYTHRESTHVNVHASLCGYVGCERVGVFGNASVGYLCSKHREVVQMSRRCKHPEGCERAAFFGSSTERVPVYCISHRKPSHINCMVRTCAFIEGCRKQPSFGAANDTLPQFCGAHKQSQHINIRHDRCAYLGCDTLINPYVRRAKQSSYRGGGVGVVGTERVTSVNANPEADLNPMNLNPKPELDKPGELDNCSASRQAGASDGGLGGGVGQEGESGRGGGGSVCGGMHFGGLGERGVDGDCVCASAGRCSKHVCERTGSVGERRGSDGRGGGEEDSDDEMLQTHLHLLCSRHAGLFGRKERERERERYR